MPKRKPLPPPTVTDLLNDAIARARLVRAGLTMSEIARRAGLSPPTLSRARTGACSATTLRRVLGAIARATDGRVDLRLGLIENA